MSIKHAAVEINKDKPFANCKLDREKYSTVLTSIIDSYPDGFVLALNNKWGTGKTTFIKMWEQSLKINKFQTLYFNAWENDFENDPLTALMGELKTLTTKDTEKKFKSTLKKAAILSKNIVPTLGRAIAQKYIDTEVIQDAIVGISKSMADVFENEVMQYERRKENISEFRKSLGGFVANTSNGKPLVFIVDELDRCRPDYAVSILEQIKHFFSIPNIVFVLSIDKVQLGNAVKGVYGNGDIDADEYLRRFIDLEYSIPEPEVDRFYEYLFDHFKFDDFFSSLERSKYRDFDRDKKEFLGTCKLLFTNSSVSLRQQEKILAHSRLALRSYSAKSNVMPQIFLFLNFIRIKHNKFYEQMKAKKLVIDDIQKELKAIIKIEINDDTERELMWLEVYLVNLYNNYFRERYYRKLLSEIDPKTGEEVALFSSIFKADSKGVVMQILKSMRRTGYKSDFSLDFFTKKIDLLENLNL